MEQKPKNKLALPITALLLNIIPYILFLWEPSIIFLFLIGIFPIAGVLVGIVALCKGRKHIGKQGVILSWAAIAWSIVFLVTMIAFSATGGLLLGM